MQLNRQVCSLDLAKRLKELCVKQESYFYWSCDHINTTQHGLSRYNLNNGIKNNSENWSAFTAAELFETLPNIIDINKDEPFNNFRFDLQRSVVIENGSLKRTFLINYHCDTMQLDSGSPFFALHLIKHNIWDENLANALAKTLIYLIDEGLVNANE